MSEGLLRPEVVGGAAGAGPLRGAGALHGSCGIWKVLLLGGETGPRPSDREISDLTGLAGGRNTGALPSGYMSSLGLRPSKSPPPTPASVSWDLCLTSFVPDLL